MKAIHIKTGLDPANVVPAYAAAHGRYYGEHIKPDGVYHIILLCQEDIAELVSLLSKSEEVAA